MNVFIQNPNLKKKNHFFSGGGGGGGGRGGVARVSDDFFLTKNPNRIF